MFPSLLHQNRVFRPWLPVGFSLSGNQLQEIGMTRVEREGRVNINPLDVSCVISSLQWQLAHAVACSSNKDMSSPYYFFCPQRDNDLRTTVYQVFRIIDTWVIMEVDSDCFHPSIVSVPRIIHIAFKDLKEKKDILVVPIEALMD